MNIVTDLSMGQSALIGWTIVWRKRWESIMSPNIISLHTARFIAHFRHRHCWLAYCRPGELRLGPINPFLKKFFSSIRLDIQKEFFCTIRTNLAECVPYLSSTHQYLRHWKVLKNNTINPRARLARLCHSFHAHA